MCFFGGNSSSPAALPPVPAPPPVPNKVANKAETDAARATQQKQAVLASGAKDTILTGGLGDQSQANVKKPTLG